MIRASAIALILAITFPAWSEPFVNTTVSGTRALGMGNNYTAVAGDYSAAIWNPGGLAFVPIREFHVSLAGTRLSTESHLNTTGREVDARRIKLSALGFLRSIPTTQGGFAFALGYHSPTSLDDLHRYAGTDTYLGSDTTIGQGSSIHYSRKDYASEGEFNLWNAAAGWQIAQGLGLGFSGSLLQGRQEMLIEFVSSHGLYGDWENSSTYKTRSYLGYDLRMGVLYTEIEPLTLGLRIELPRYARVLEESRLTDSLDFSNNNVYKFQGALRSSFSGAVGAAVTLPLGTISSDLLFRSPTVSSLTRRSDREAASWKIGLGLGTEIPLRPLPVLLRAGYSLRELDFRSHRIEWDGSGEERPDPVRAISDVHLLTAGVGILLGHSTLFEAAYGYSAWSFSTPNPEWAHAVEERHRSHTALVSLSIRY